MSNWRCPDCWKHPSGIVHGWCGRSQIEHMLMREGRVKPQPVPAPVTPEPSLKEVIKLLYDEAERRVRDRS